jgi:uncharacterized protein (TIGR02757 family)
LSGVAAEQLEALYSRYNDRKYVDPDPLLFLYRYDEVRDREIAGLMASSLAYGRVAQILRSAGAVLDVMGAHPFEFVRDTPDDTVDELLCGFKHRFTKGEEVAGLMHAVRRILNEYGSLNDCYLAGLDSSSSPVAALDAFAKRINPGGGYLIPHPDKGSACKRLNLYLRWMIRSDAVDPGGWEGVSPAGLLVPLDTHLARIVRELGLSERKSADLKMAVEVTEAFRMFAPEDPVKYDFALTRFGIHTQLRNESLAEALDSGQD